MANTIVLNEYTAAIKDSPKKYLEFGTYDSYGREHITVMPESGWEDLSVYATFISPKKVKRTVLLTDPVIPVPKDATAATPVQLALALGGDVMPETTMIFTP